MLHIHQCEHSEVEIGVAMCSLQTHENDYFVAMKYLVLFYSAIFDPFFSWTDWKCIKLLSWVELYASSNEICVKFDPRVSNSRK